MSSIRKRTFLKRFFKVSWSPLLIQFPHGGNKTIFKNLEQEFESSHTKLKPKLPHILNFANILEGERKRQTKMTAFTEYQYDPSLSLNCWAQLCELISIYQYAKTYLNPKNLTWINNFHSRIILSDAHSKHILLILVIDSQNFRKLQGWFSEFD